MIIFSVCRLCFERCRQTMQIKELYSIEYNIDGYFRPELMKSDSWIFYSDKEYCYLKSKRKVIKLKIKNGYGFVVINKFAYIINEDLCIFKVNLEIETCICVLTDLLVDSNIYKYKDYLLVSEYDSNNGTYKLVMYDDKFERHKLLYQCNEFYIVNDDLFIVIYENKYTNIYKFDENGILRIGKTKRFPIMLDELNFNSRIICSHNGFFSDKKIHLYDFDDLLLKKFKFKKTINDCKFVCNGKYLLVCFDNEVYVYKTNSFEIVEIIEFKHEKCIRILWCNENCFTLLTYDKIILFEFTEDIYE